MDDSTKMMKYDANKKSMVVAYLLFIFFGWLEIHRFYLGERKSAFYLLLCGIFGHLLLFERYPSSITLTMSVGYFLIAIYTIMYFVDIFRTYLFTKRYNNKLIDKLNK